MSDLLHDTLKDHVYDAKLSAQTAMDITTSARTRLKALALPRCVTVNVYTMHSANRNISCGVLRLL